jgi:hypothetical protein
MIAYKFLRSDGSGIFSGFRWPEPGEWVEATIEACRSGIHACRAGDLPYWLARNMWEVELGGEILEGRMKVVASRGRLVRPVDAWDDAARDAYVEMCAARAHELAARAGGDWDAVIEPSRPEGPALLGYIPARIAEELDGAEGYHRERASQAAWLVDRLGLSA